MINQLSTSIRMSSSKNHLLLLLFCLGFLMAPCFAYAQEQDRFPFREYTNPDEVIRFDRSTEFARALDVINQFSQEKRGKVIIDRTGTQGPIGIAVPPMHWKDALELILNVKDLALIEQPDFYEIVEAPEDEEQGQAQAQRQIQTASDTLTASTSTKEVRINAIFFEGNKRALREVGVDWSTLSEDVPDNVGSFVNQEGGGGGGGDGGGDGGGGGGGSGQLPSTNFDDGPFVQVNQKGAQSVSQNVFNALVNFGEIGTSGIEVQALFSAFEADNLGEILSSPSVKVMDGQPGRIQVGQDFSIKQRDFAGNVTDEFFSVGTILEVTPTVIEQEDTTFIHLNIDAERSSAQPDPVSTIINKQEASTQSLLLNGETTVIAGLYSTEKNEVRRGIPILKDLPPWFFGLRYLFGFTSEDDQMRELVILIEASIEPSIPERFAQRERMPGKFEVLEEERSRIRDEIEKQSDYTRSLDDEYLETPDSLGQFPDPDLEMEEDSVMSDSLDVSETEENKEQNADPNPESDQTRNSSDDEAPEEADTKVVDPEIKSKAVPLNFTTEDSVTADEKKEEEMPEDQPDKQDREKRVEQTADDEKAVNTGNQNTDAQYYIIAGSFKNKSNAEDYSNKLISEGYDNARILQKEGSDFLLVAYAAYQQLEEAQSELLKIQENRNAGAWVYKAR